MNKADWCVLFLFVIIFGTILVAYVADKLEEINDLKQENERLERELKKACKRLSDK